MEILIETYRNPGEPSSADIRVRPVAGQRMEGVTLDGLKVECSKAMRSAAPLGTRYWLEVKLSRRKDGGYYLYSKPSAVWQREDR